LKPCSRATSAPLTVSRCKRDIAQHILDHGFDKAVIITDGYAGTGVVKQEEMKKHKLRILTILFGGKADCDEFAPFGGVVQLEDATD